MNKPILAAVCISICVVHGDLLSQPHVVSVTQGFSLRARIDNRGLFGIQAYPGGNPPADSLGLAYPVGQPIEHLYGAGLWIGGKLDTARVGTRPQLRLVSTAHEGWSGLLYEFYPGPNLADSIWQVWGENAPEPPGWGGYWGGELPFDPISDNDDYCTYTDTGITNIAGHIPLRLKVIHSSFVWDDPYAEAILIVEYRITNRGNKAIDSAYVGFFFEGDVGPTSVSGYWQHNYAGYYSAIHTAYIHNPIDPGSTPVGLRILASSQPLRFLAVYV